MHMDTEIGTKSSLQTGVPPDVLLMNSPEVISVAERKAWAYGGQTFKPEDKAYCLMGLLGVEMPVKYGEGEEEGSRRLDVEIDKLKDDSSHDPSSFHASDWAILEPEYQFIIAVQHPPTEATRIEYPDVSGPVWTIRDWLMVLI